MIFNCWQLIVLQCLIVFLWFPENWSGNVIWKKRNTNICYCSKQWYEIKIVPIDFTIKPRYQNDSFYLKFLASCALVFTEYIEPTIFSRIKSSLLQSRTFLFFLNCSILLPTSFIYCQCSKISKSHPFCISKKEVLFRAKLLYHSRVALHCLAWNI